MLPFIFVFFSNNFVDHFLSPVRPVLPRVKGASAKKSPFHLPGYDKSLDIPQMSSSDPNDPGENIEKHPFRIDGRSTKNHPDFICNMSSRDKYALCLTPLVLFARDRWLIAGLASQSNLDQREYQK